MNRRGFLGTLGAAIAGAALDPELALWVPGKRLISVPRVRKFHIGETIYVRRPMRFLIDTEASDQLFQQALREISKQATVDAEFLSGQTWELAALARHFSRLA